jgi:hypothetical protein
MVRPGKLEVKRIDCHFLCSRVSRENPMLMGLPVAEGENTKRNRVGTLSRRGKNITGTIETLSRRGKCIT